MPTITAGASQNIALPAGQTITFDPSGSGNAVIANGQEAGTGYKLGGAQVVIGPFTTARTISVAPSSNVGYFLGAAVIDVTATRAAPGFEPSLASPGSGAGAVAEVVRPALDVVVIGDSWGQRNYAFSATAQAYSDLGSVRWGIALSGQRLRQILPTAAVGGSTSGQWLSTYLDAVLDQLDSPCRVEVFLGTNDISSDVPVGAVGVPDSFIDNMNTIYRRILDRGHILCANTIPPYGPSYVVTGASLAVKNIARRVANKWLTEFAAANPNIEFTDQYSALVDPTNANGYMFAAFEDALSGGGNNPGIHCSAAGARAVGAQKAARWASLPDPRQHVSSTTDSYDTDTAGSNRINNPLFAGTGGTTVQGAGTTITATAIATNWIVATAASGTATVVATTAARTVANDGDTIGQNQVLTITGATAPDLVSLRTGSLAGRFAVGDQIFAEVYIKATGMTNVNGIRLIATHILDGVSNIYTDMSYLGTGASYSQSDEMMVLRTPVYTIGSASALSGQIMTIDIDFIGAGGAVIAIGRAQWRKVN